MKVVPLTLKQANSFVAKHHRHHKPVVGHRFSFGAKVDGKLVGIAIVGRPVARLIDQYAIAEVTRVCTDGTRNACSFLYGASVRICRAMGFDKVQTYTLPEEGGASLRAAGWQFVGETSAGGWTRENRPNRRTDQPIGVKHKWQKELR